MRVKANDFPLPYNGKYFKLAEPGEEGVPPLGPAILEEIDSIYGKSPSKEEVSDFLREFIISSRVFKLPDAGKYKGVPVTWIPGMVGGSERYGPYKADIAIVYKGVDPDDRVSGRLFSGDVGDFMASKLEYYDLLGKDIYVTSITKFGMPYSNMKSIPAAWTKECLYFLHEELRAVDPDFLLLLGTEALKFFCGKKATLKTYRGEPIDIPWLNAKAIVTNNPSTVLRNPEKTGDFLVDLNYFANMVKGREQRGIEECNYEVIWDIDRLRQVVDSLMSYSVFAVDVETTGLDYREGELLTIQLSHEPRYGYAVALQSKVSGKEFYPTRSSAVLELRRLLCRPEVSIVGHNFRFDIAWLQDIGLELSNQFLVNGFDTMLASHTLDEVNEHDLSSCTLRETDMGRYDAIMGEYLTKGKHHWEVPDDVLHKYGCADVDATYRIYLKYRQRLWDYHLEYASEKGLDPYSIIYPPDSPLVKKLGWHPTLWNLYRHIILPVNGPITEIETVGILTDKDMLIDMIGKFEKKRDRLQEVIRTMLGIPDFNPRSPQQCQEILFGDPNKLDEEGRVIGCLGLIPIKTTGKRPQVWEEVVGKGEVWYEEGYGWKSNQHAPGTDGEVLSVLADDQNSEVAAVLRDFRFIDQICKNFLIGQTEDADTGVVDYHKGLIGYSGSDGRIRTSISQLTDTGRWRSSHPNLQNLPKGREGDIAAIFKDDDFEDE